MKPTVVANTEDDRILAIFFHIHQFIIIVLSAQSDMVESHLERLPCQIHIICYHSYLGLDSHFLSC